MSVETIPALFLNAVKSYNKQDAFRYKRGGSYVAVSHLQAFDRVDKASRGLLSAAGLAKGDRVALLSENRLEWALADLAILSAGCINVPIYATLPPAQIEYILRDSEARAIFVSTEEQLAKITEIRSGLPNLSTVIVFDDEVTGAADLPFDVLIEKGALIENQPAYEDRIATIGRYDWASIIYTSGTTGDPKGVILTHWNFVSNVEAALEVIKWGPKDCCLSFLPLSHVFERMGGYYAMLHGGATIAYAESIETVPENLREVRPTIMISVPRLYEKMYARILEAVAAGSALKKKLFFWALGVGKQYVHEKLSKSFTLATRLKYQTANRLVFSKLKARTGGRLRFFVSGSAPLAREIAEFFYAAGLPVLEGYGLTETSPLISVNTFEDFKFGTVGKPAPGVDVKIADDGEILAKGPNIMVGYYKKPDLTKEVLIDGWLHTGDIGHLDDDGFLVITDRKKDIIVTAGGKNVAPQPIENILKTSDYVTEAVLIGDKRKFISAIVVANMEKVRLYADTEGISSATDSDLVKEPRIIKKIQEEIDLRSGHLASFERVKKFVLVAEDFSIEANELTPTLKVKRKSVESKFAPQIEALYA